MPFLQSSATKITVKSPILFPVLQNLIDTCTNHEFVVDKNGSSAHFNGLNEAVCYAFDNDSPQNNSANSFLVKSSVNHGGILQTSLEGQIYEILNHLLDQVQLTLHLSNTSSHNNFHNEVNQCVNDLVDSVANKLSIQKYDSSILLQKKTSPTRPTTLALGTRSYDQSARNEHELGTRVEHPLKASRLSIFVNRCSNQDEDHENINNNLVASTLVSPDTPRAKRKYQQLNIDGNAYANLGLKVTTRPTYCCIFRLQPMYVTQDSNPQLSMYSQWKNYPVPSGDVLELVKTPHELMSAYNSQEAVFAVSRYRLSLVEVATAATMGGLEIDLGQNKQCTEYTSGIVTREFLDKISSRLSNFMSTNVIKSQNSTAKSLSVFSKHTFERYLRALVISLGEGFSDRLSDTCTRSQFITTHSSYHRLSQFNRSQQQRIRKRSRSHNFDYSKGSTSTSEMGIASNISPSSVPYLSQSEQVSRLPITESSNIKLPDITSWAKPRKRSSNMSASSLSSSNFSPYLTMHPMLGHLPVKSKQTVMYIMMMSQAPLSMAVPTVGSMSSISKNLASRKFSECIGMKPSVIEENWGARMGADGTTEIVPKRIKIFEGE